MRFLPRCRRFGCRRYERIGKPRKSLTAAAVAMSRAFAETGDYKRGDVLMITSDGWYEPVVLMEITR